MTHLGEEISALVDGELGHDARDRALAHIASCADCRAAVDAERRIKAAVSRLDPVALPPALRDRLVALPAELSAPHGLRAGTAWLTGHRPSRARNDARGPAGTRPPSTSRRRRRVSAATGSVALVGACVAAFVVGGGPANDRPVTPQVQRFSVEHASVAPEVPLSDEGGPAVVVSFPLPAAP